MKFSVCIPNYNYERYLAETIASVLEQQVVLEVLVSDNASTDGSVRLVRDLGDQRVKLTVNRRNVGFSANLDRAARGASGDLMMMLSSDDVLMPGSLNVYERLFETWGPSGGGVIASAACHVIDPRGERVGMLCRQEDLWPDGSRDTELSQALGVAVFRREPRELLRDCLKTMRNPFNFAATVYGADLYRSVEGYGGGRQINPDKWFHWRALGEAEVAFFIDAPLVSYRWHDSNQTAQQANSGALKYLVDEYACTLELEETLLARMGLSRKDVVEAFVEYDIARHGLATLARGDRARARRVLRFGQAAYPEAVGSNPTSRVLSALLALRGLGKSFARLSYTRYRTRKDRAEEGT